MKTLSFAGFVGAVSLVELKQESSGGYALIVKKLLGTAFVVDPEKRLFVTNDHVLPDCDVSQAQLTFVVYVPGENNVWKPGLVNKGSIQRCPGKDLICFQIEPIGIPLRTLPLYNDNLVMGMQTMAFGIPPDHEFYGDSGQTKAVVRTITSFVVSIYKEEFEISAPLITGMSGGPMIFHEKICGVVYRNKKVGLEQYSTEETITTLENGAIHKKEVFEYSLTV